MLMRHDMNTRMAALLFFHGLCFFATACSTKAQEGTSCFGGCACYATPDMCPTGCGATYTKGTDGGVAFSCQNVSDAGAGDE